MAALADGGVVVMAYAGVTVVRGDGTARQYSDKTESFAGRNPMPTPRAGFMRRDEAMARYAERTGCDLSAIPYYIAFGTFKMGVVLQQIYIRFHRGQTQDERFAGMGQLATSLYHLAADRRP